MMKIDDKGLSLIKQFEGCSLVPYLDSVGVATIGYGCTRYENGTKVSMADMPISQQRADELLRHLVVEFEDGVNKLVSVNISQNQFNALVSFAFNLGLNSLKNSTLLQRFNSGDTLDATCEFTRWRFANKKPLKGLLRRRLAEASLFLDD